MARNIEYNLNINNNTDKEFKKVNEDLKESNSAVDKLKKGFSEIGSVIKTQTEKDVKGLGKSLVMAVTAPIRLITSLISGLVKMGIGAVKNVIIMALLVKVVTSLGDALKKNEGATDKFGKTVNTLGGYLQQLLINSAPLKLIFSTIGTGNAAIERAIPVYGQMADKFRTARVAIDAFAAGYNKMKLSFSEEIGVKGPAKVSFLPKSNTLDIENAGARVKSAAEGFHKAGKDLSDFIDKTKEAVAGIKIFGKDLSGIIDKTKQGITKAERLGGNIIKVTSFIAKHWKAALVAGTTLAAGIASLVITWKTLNQVINEGDAIDKFSRRIGFTAKEYVAFDYVLQRAGSSIKEMEGAFASFSKRSFDAARETGEARVAFEMLGVEVKTAQGELRGNAEIITEVITKLSNLENKALRNSIALSVFGEQGRNLIPMLDEFGGGLTAAMGKFDKLEPIIKRTTAASAAYKDNMTDLSTAWKMFRMELFTGTIERLNDFFEIAKNSPSLQLLGGVIGIITKGIVGLGEALIDVVNVLLSSFDTILLGVSQLFGNIEKIYLTGLHNLFNAMRKVPLLQGWVSDKELEGVKTRLGAASSMVIQMEKETTASAERTVKALKSLVKWRDATAPVATATGASPVIPVAKDKSTTTNIYNTKIDNNVFNQSMNERLAILDAYATKSIMLVKNQYERERQLLAVSLEQNGDELAKAELFGVITTEESLRLRAIAYKEYSAAIKAIEKEQMISYAQSMAKAFEMIHSNFANLKSVLESSSDGMTGFQEGMLGSLDAINSSLGAVVDNIGNAKEAIFAGLQAAASGFSQVIANSNNRAIESVNKWYTEEKDKLDKSRMGQRRRAKEEAKLLEEKEKKEDEARRDAFKKNKAMALISTVINTAAAVMKTFGTLGFPAGIPASIAVGALGLVQMGLIASQQFANGGIVKGPESGDNVNVRANGGEMFLNKRQQSNLFDMINRGGGSAPINITMGETIINGSADYATLAAIDERNDRQKQFFVETLETLAYEGRVQRIVL